MNVTFYLPKYEIKSQDFKAVKQKNEQYVSWLFQNI